MILSIPWPSRHKTRTQKPRIKWRDRFAITRSDWKAMSGDQKRSLLLRMAMVMAVFTTLSAHLLFTTTVSLDNRIYWIGSGQPVKGDYATFQLSHELIGTWEVTKRIACAAGETIRVEGRGFWCGDTWLGEAKPEALDGRPLPYAPEAAGVIPEGQVFLMGDHPDSFDSRYYGLKPVNTMTRLIPIF